MQRQDREDPHVPGNTKLSLRCIWQGICREGTTCALLRSVVANLLEIVSDHPFKNKV